MRPLRLLLATLLILAVALSLAQAFQARGLEYTSWLASVISLFLPLAGLFVWVSGRRSDPGPHTIEDLDRAAGHLAFHVSEQWAEASRRLLLEAPAMTVTWRFEPVTSGVGNGGSPGEATYAVTEIDRIADWYRALPIGRLLVLGGPGTGKTGLVIQLINALYRRNITEQQRVVPVLLFVHGWDTGCLSVNDWVIRCLNSDYPSLRAEFGERAAEHLVRTGRVLPILDGLDELPGRPREDLLAKLRHHNRNDRLILTTRDDIDACKSGMFPVEARARSLPMTTAQVTAYLRECGADGPLWKRIRRQLGDPEGPLAQALRTPLTLWLLSTALTDRSTTDAVERFLRTEPETAGRIRDKLLDLLVPALLRVHAHTRGGAVPTVMPSRDWGPQRAQKVLRFLARHLRNQETENIAWWRLHGSGIYLHATVPMLLLILLGWGVGLALELTFALLVGVWLGFLAFAGTFGPTGPPVAVRPVRRVGRWGVVAFLLLSVAGGVAAGSIVGWVTWMTADPAIGLLAGGIAGVGTTTIGVIDTITEPSTTESVTTPISLLRSDRLLCVLTALTVSLTLGVTTGLILTLAAGLWSGVLVDLVHGLSLSLLLGVGVGVSHAWRRHAWPTYVTTKVALALTGRVPWRLMTFLEDMHRIGVLRRVGSVYQFRHTDLQSRLASTDTEPGDEAGDRAARRHCATI